MTTSPRRHLDTTRRRTRLIAGAGTAIALVAVFLVLVLGDSDDKSGPSGRNSEPSTSAPDSSGSAGDGATSGSGSDSGSGASGSTGGADDAILTPADLDGFVLRGSDLPPGWRTLDSAGSAAQELVGACLRTATTPTVPHVVSTVSFRSGSNGPILSSSVRDFTTEAQAERAMAAVRTSIRGCLRGPSKPPLRPLAVSSTADASAAVSFTLLQDGASARGELMVARVGARSVTMVLVGLVEEDLDVGQDALQTVVDRLR